MLISNQLRAGVLRAYSVAIYEGKSHKAAIGWVAQQKGLPEALVAAIIDEQHFGKGE